MTASVLIDPEWRKTVVSLLKAQAANTIKWDPRGEERFQNDYAPLWPYEAADAMAGYLESEGALGLKVELDFAPGSTWKFFFPFNGGPAFGKITLSTDGKKIKIWSAHLPAGAQL